MQHVKVRGKDAQIQWILRGSAFLWENRWGISPSSPSGC